MAIAASEHRERVIVTINGHSSSTRIAIMRGRNLIGLSNANRTAAGVEIGGDLVVRVVLEHMPVTVIEATEITAALNANPVARAAFDRLTTSQRKQHVRVIEQAKGVQTRARRIEKLLKELHDRNRS